MERVFRHASVLLVVLLGLSEVEGRLRVCYYSNWSQYRQSAGKFFPVDIDPFLCTHLIYSFAKLTDNHELATYEWNDNTLYADFNGLKASNTKLKTLIAVGGWNEGSARFTALVSDPSKRAKFVTTSVNFVKTWGFDGLDLDWEYPAARGGVASDKANFAKLCQELRQAFDAESPRLLLTAAVPAGKNSIDNGYDVPKLNMYLDFINLMSYDLHGAWEDFTGFNSPLHARSDEYGEQALLNMEWAANYWVSLGASKDKMIIGLATYGRSFTLASAANYYPGAAARGAGPQGPYTASAGFLAYYEICDKIADGSGTRYWDSEHKVPYVVAGTEWIGYDDVQSITDKVNWIIDEEFGGAMVWNIDLDDFKQSCALSSRPYPLMNTMKDILLGNQPPATTDAPKTTEEPETTDEPEITDPPGTTEEPETTDDPETTEEPEITDAPYTTDAPGTTESPVTADPEADLLAPSDGILCCRLLASGVSSKYSSSLASWSNFIFWFCNGLSIQPLRNWTKLPEITCSGSAFQGPVLSNIVSYDCRYCAGMANGFYKDVSNCKKFYHCDNQCTYPKTCPGDLLWNDVLKYCDWDYNVNCGETASTEAPATTPKATNSFCSDKANGFYADVADCTMFYQCWTKITYHKTCQNNLQWNQNLQYCDYPENVNCGLSVTNPPATTDGGSTYDPITSPQVTVGGAFCANKRNGIYKNENDCGSFYNCWSGVDSIRDCGEGQLFDAHILSCRAAGETDCSLEQDMTGFCVGQNGIFPYPDDCQKYYNCANDMAYIMTCQDPYLYNPAGYCDWDYNVNCGERPVN